VSVGEVSKVRVYNPAFSRKPLYGTPAREGGWGSATDRSGPSGLPRNELATEEAMSLQFEAGVRIISLMFLIALTGCTTWAPPDPSPWRWRKEGVTVEQQRRDQAECATAADRAYNASAGDTAVRAAAASRVAADCFRAKGYYSPAR
jgi:hypothetical protein